MPSGLFVTMKFKPDLGGLQEHAHQITKHLNELGLQTTVLTPSRPEYAEVDKAFDESCGYPVVRFDTKVASGEWLTPYFYRRGLVEILGAARRANPDYMIVNATGSTLSLSALLAARLTRTPLITVTLGRLNLLTLPRRAALNFVLGRASSNVCDSSYAASWVAACGIDPVKISIIPNGVDLREIESWRARSGSSPQAATFPKRGPVVLTVARLSPLKGVRTVIRAMPRIVSEVPGTRYVIVGDGEDEEHLMALAAESPVADAITFLGALTGDDKFDCYSRCDVFAMPSTRIAFRLYFRRPTHSASRSSAAGLVAFPTP